MANRFDVEIIRRVGFIVSANVWIVLNVLTQDSSKVHGGSEAIFILSIIFVPYIMMLYYGCKKVDGD